MSTMKMLCVAIGLLVAASCASMGPPVPVQGQAGDIERLVGSWWGEYSGDPGHDRTGTIVFELSAVEAHAHGDVVMTPEAGARAYQRPPIEEWRRVSPELAPMSRVLTIRFVYVERGGVEGVLDAFWDPDRQTEASTTFRGVLDGGRIDGTFITTYRSGAPATTGRWSVTRRARD